VAGVAIASHGASVASSDSNGNFAILQTGSARLQLAFTAPGYVERRTGVSVPGSHARISLIPASFDLAAFDQMVRATALARWVAAPELVVVANTLTFSSSVDAEFAAAAELLTPAELDGLTATLTQALAILTADRIPAFARVSVLEFAPGIRVGVQRTGAIVVARYAGLLNATGFQGVSRWAVATDGSIAAATMFLDRDYDKSPNATIRPLRMHELGHALGYAHISSRPSVMNPIAAGEPTAWDRQAASVAFQRPPGNRSPDIDPDAFSTNAASVDAGADPVWGPPIP
jgi:hypothetical protein